MAIMRRFIQYIGSIPWIIFSVCYLISFIILQYSGLFSLPPVNIMRALHKPPALMGAALLGLSAVGMIFAERNSYRGQEKTSKSGANLLMAAGILAATIGIFISALTRFEASVMLVEGDQIALSNETYIPGSIYQTKYASMPTGIIAVDSITPFFTSKNKPRHIQSARIILTDNNSTWHSIIKPATLIPDMVKGTFYSLRDVGYAPHVILFNHDGTPIEDIFPTIRTFPPGTEDYFRFDVIPHTFFIKYYPDASMIPKETGKNPPASGPVCEIRIARNLELIAARYITPKDTIAVDALFLSIPDVKQWIEINIVRDYGILLILVGLIVACIGAMGVLKKKTS